MQLVIFATTKFLPEIENEQHELLLLPVSESRILEFQWETVASEAESSTLYNMPFKSLRTVHGKYISIC